MEEETAADEEKEEEKGGRCSSGLVLSSDDAGDSDDSVERGREILRQQRFGGSVDDGDCAEDEIEEMSG